MVKSLFLLYLKRFKGMFLAMVFLLGFSMVLLITFSSGLDRLHEGFDYYCENHGSPTISYTIDITEKANFQGLDEVEGVRKVESRIKGNLPFYKVEEKPLYATVSTFIEGEEGIINPYIYDSIAKKEDGLNALISSKIARKNEIALGDEVRIGLMGYSIPVHVYGFFDDPSTIQLRPYEFVSSDRTLFGELLFPESEFPKVKTYVYDYLRDEVGHVQFDSYLLLLSLRNRSLYDLLKDIGNNGGEALAKRTNEILIEGKEGYEEEKIDGFCKDFLANKVPITKTVLESKSVYFVYIDRIHTQFTVVGLFTPLFFYSVSLALIALFFIQIIQSSSKEIGILLSLGHRHRDILLLLLSLSLAVAFFACLVALGGGIGFTHLIVRLYSEAYTIPTLSPVISPLPYLLSCLIAFVVAAGSVGLSSFRLFRLTPNDAVENQENKRKNTPKQIQRGLDKMRNAPRLAFLSILQNPKRFFISFFSLFGSITMVCISTLFFISSSTVIKEAPKVRQLYDAQVFCIDGKENALITQEISELDYVTKLERAYYGYEEIHFGEKTFSWLIYAFDTKNQTLTHIPGEKYPERMYVEEEGVIIPKSESERLGIHKGDTLRIGQADLPVTGISDQFNPMYAFMSISSIEKTAIPKGFTYFVSTTDVDALRYFISKQTTPMLTMVTTSVQNHFIETNTGLSLMIDLLIAFSLLIGLSIQLIVGQGKLLEQRKSLSILRLHGYTLGDISTVFAIQEGMEFVLASLFALPVAHVFSALLFAKASTTSLVYPLLITPLGFLLPLGFVFALLVVSHIVSLFKINRWNLADNTRAKE